MYSDNHHRHPTKYHRELHGDSKNRHIFRMSQEWHANGCRNYTPSSAEPHTKSSIYYKWNTFAKRPFPVSFLASWVGFLVCHHGGFGQKILQSRCEVPTNSGSEPPCHEDFSKTKTWSFHICISSSKRTWPMKYPHIPIFHRKYIFKWFILQCHSASRESESPSWLSESSW